MGCVHDLEVCDCSCHRNKNVKHCMPCCGTCPHCRRHIRFFHLEPHIKACAGKKEDMLLKILEPLLAVAWCRETASPGCADAWSGGNPALGQCAVTALLVQELLGGELLRSIVDGHGSHYFNRLPSGRDLDLTRGQFPEGTAVPPGEPVDRERVLRSDRAVQARTEQRYELLKTRLASV